MLRRAKMDRRARQVALQIGASRVAMGIGIFLATRPALRVLGFGEPNAGAEALAKLGGGRDIAIGALTLASLDDRRARRLRRQPPNPQSRDRRPDLGQRRSHRRPLVLAPALAGVGRPSPDTQH